MGIPLITYGNTLCEYFLLETIGIGVKHIVIYIYIYYYREPLEKSFEIPIDKWSDAW